MARLLFTEQFYHPEGWGGAQLPRDLTVHLANSGFSVEVICGSDQYVPEMDQSTDDPRSAGVSIRRLPRIFGGDFHKRKLGRQLWFYLAVIPALVFRRSPDLFVTQTNPPLIVPLVGVAAWLHRRPYLVIAQDLYPEVVFAHGMLPSNGLLGRFLSWLFRRAFRNAELVVSLGPTMTRRLQEKGVRPERIATISNWSTGDDTVVRGGDNELRDEWGLTNKFVVLYSGNLGISHDIETPIRAIAELSRDVPHIQLLFVGKGSRLEEATALVKDMNLERFVQFRSFLPFRLLPHSLGLAHIALVTLRDGFEGLVVPSKCLGYMARGVPTLYVGPDSDVQSLLSESGARSFANGQYHALAREIGRLVKDKQALDEMGARAQALYQTQLARSIALEKYCRLLQRIRH